MLKRNKHKYVQRRIKSIAESEKKKASYPHFFDQKKKQKKAKAKLPKNGQKNRRVYFF
jgi:hypothetical protein